MGFPNRPGPCHNRSLLAFDVFGQVDGDAMSELRPPVFVHLLPGLIPPTALKDGVAVVVDVLRATTAMVHALAAGVEAIIPCGEVDEARRVAASLPPGTAILGGERGGLPIEGFDLGNSPASYTREICQGKTLVMTTTNGTRAILASLEADRVLIAAFSNLTATCQYLALNYALARPRPVHVVCAGTEGFISTEDTLLAGAIADEVTARWHAPRGNDEALLAISHWKSLGLDENVPRLAERSQARVASALRAGRGGHNVARIGLLPDIDDAADIDRFDLAAEVVRDPLRIVKELPGWEA